MRKLAERLFGMLGTVVPVLLGIYVGQALPPPDLGKRLAEKCARTIVQPFQLFEVDAARQHDPQDDDKAESERDLPEVQTSRRDDIQPAHGHALTALRREARDTGK